MTLKCASDSQTCYGLRLFSANGNGAPPVGKYNLARGGLFNTSRTIKERRFPGTVRPYEADDFAPVDVKGDIFEGFQAAKAFVKVFYF
jgi:hypothetical protein